MRRVLALTMTIVLLLSFSVNAQTTIVEKGDYIQLGSYKGTELAWQIIDVDSKGVATLFSRYIVERMAFDAAESGIAGSGFGVQAYGSNRFYNSNVREWLNSDEDVITYSTMKPTTESIISMEDIEGSVMSGLTAEYKGFLSDFTANEKLSLIDATFTTDMSLTFDIGKISVIDEAKTIETMSSKVFLLSLKEYKELVVDSNLEMEKADTNGEVSYYWLRTPNGNDTVQVATIDPRGNVFKTTANYAYTGVVPAVKIDLNMYPLLSGLGTAVSPYVLDYSYAQPITDQLSTSDQNEIENTVKMHKATLTVDNTFAMREEVARLIETDIQSSEDPYRWRLGYLYYMNQLELTLHRQIFSQSHLLKNKTVSNVSFQDLDSISDDAHNAISIMSSIGIVNGYTDGTFKPNNTITRAELSKILTQMTQARTMKMTKSFADVTYSDWYYLSVESASVEGYIIGYTDGTFKPNSNVTYDELATMLSRIIVNDYGYYPSTVNQVDQLQKDAVVADWATLYVSQMIENEILDLGQAYNGTLYASRADVMILCNKIRERIYE